MSFCASDNSATDPIALKCLKSLAQFHAMWHGVPCHIEMRFVSISTSFHSGNRRQPKPPCYTSSPEETVPKEIEDTWRPLPDIGRDQRQVFTMNPDFVCPLCAKASETSRSPPDLCLTSYALIKSKSLSSECNDLANRLCAREARCPPPSLLPDQTQRWANSSPEILRCLHQGEDAV